MGERTGWRDPDLKPWHEEHGFVYPATDVLPPISERHRKWGHVYGTDIDWPYMEYDYGIALALIDYKFRDGLKETGNETDKGNYNNMALSDLRTSRGPLPYYINFYIKLPWTFRVFPINDEARNLAPKQQMLTERDYVEWLHELRGHQVNQYLAVVRKCDDQILWGSLLPPDEQPRKRKNKKNHEKSPYTLFDQNPIRQQKLEDVS